MSKRKFTRAEFLQPTSLHGVVLPSDLDLNLHMNNSKYLREMDFGRFSHILEKHIYSTVLSLGGTIVVAATMIRYRRSLQLWQRFKLKTEILCWGSDVLYMEQRFVGGDGFVYAVALLKMSVKGRGSIVEKVLEKVCTVAPQSPPFPPEVQSWVETIARSKERMKKERS